MSHNTSWEYSEGVCFIEVVEGGKTPALSYSILLDNITAKGEQAQSALEAKFPP